MAANACEHDHRRRRCPMLGHEVSFGYCRKPARELPCGKVFDCWFETFDVAGFVRQICSDEEIERITAPRQDKAATLVELIQKARERARRSGE